MPTTVGSRRVYGVYFTTKGSRTRVDMLFSSLHFTRVNLDVQPHGTVEQAIADLTAQAEEWKKEAAQVEEELKTLREQEGERLLSDYAYLRYHSECRELRRFACRSRITGNGSLWKNCWTEGLRFSMRAGRLTARVGQRRKNPICGILICIIWNF